MSFGIGYISDFIGRSVVVRESGKLRTLGKVTDFLVTKPDDAFPRIDGMLVKTRDGLRWCPIADVLKIDERGPIVLTQPPNAPPVSDEHALFLVADLFDKQIVDVNGRKVVRINDIEVAQTGGALRIVAADVGFSGLLRRLGIKHLAPSFVARIPKTLISWSHVAPISDVNPSQVRLSVSAERLAGLHPSELADIIGELSAQDAARIVRSLDDETAADALEHLDSDTQRALIDNLGTERAADIIEEMDSDDAADLLGDLPQDTQAALLAQMEPETAGELRDLVRYADDSAGGLMTTDYVWIYPHRSVSATIDKIREIAPETEFIYYLYVTDAARKLLGVVSLRRLLLAQPTAHIHTIMDSDIVSVRPATSGKEVAAIIARYDMLACPVLDDEGRLLGIVTVDDAIDAILPEKLARALPHFTRRSGRSSAGTIA
ncbi:MAG TPA: CBS domain-containing protein [Candidatus Baltobacteraceae bacterium]|jgi:CBS domain-containing protein|nr:CBS domain-containing protein [Candidatus Baltobacteraceae bacterium]